MQRVLALLLAAGLFAAGSALAQQPDKGRGAQMQKQSMQPREGMRDERREFRRERLSRDERDKLRRDLLEANRDMKGKR